MEYLHDQIRNDADEAARLRRMTKERDGLKKPPRILPRGKDRVRVRLRPRQWGSSSRRVPGALCSSEQLLRLASCASVPTACASEGCLGGLISLPPGRTGALPG